MVQAQTGIIAENWIGRTIPGTDLVVQKRVAVTATSRVYQVRSSSIGRDFCAKFVPRVAGRRSWQREIAALAELRNPHIVKLFRMVEVDDDIVVVTDWAEGESLAELIATEGPFHPLDVIYVGKHIAAALHAVHSIGLVHRDVKPSNVMINLMPNGDPFAQLLDFGIAKESGGGLSSGVVGSPVFSAPEQIAEQEVDARTDIYQLGCLLFYMLTGEPPFVAADGPSVMNAHLYQPAPRASSHVSSIARWGLDDLVLRMLGKDPETRPQSCMEVIELLGTGRQPTAAQTNPLPPDLKQERVAVGPDRTFATAQGNRISVFDDGSSAHFHLDKEQAVTVVHAEPGVVYYGTQQGRIGRLDVVSSKISIVVELPRMRPIVGLSRLEDRVLATDDTGAVFFIEESGSYQVLRSLGARTAKAVQIAGAEQAKNFAVAYDDHSIGLFDGDAEPRSVGTVQLDFEPRHVAVSPDGYVVAVIGDDVMWLLNGLDGTVMHRLPHGERPAHVTFIGGTLVGLEFTRDGDHKLFEIH